ncbi:MAG: hypothetical protein DRP09_12100 [Candidatus Thorarchaeota archaeon]|nr:MAG: hypothetical protein DRP09_12100 [Candidatus Thorarchaeota archaeon]
MPVKSNSSIEILSEPEGEYDFKEDFKEMLNTIKSMYYLKGKVEGKGYSWKKMTIADLHARLAPHLERLSTAVSEGNLNDTLVHTIDAITYLFFIGGRAINLETSEV